MSVTHTNKSGEIGSDNCDLMAADDRSNYGWVSHSPVRWIGPAAACLALLLLMVTLGVVVKNGRAIRDQNNIQVDLRECEAQVYNLSKAQDALSGERNQLRINASKLSKDIEVLQSQYNTLAASRDKLEEEVTRLNASIEKCCPPGWMKYNNKCYYASDSGETKNWQDSRRNCVSRGADLVIITTRDKLEFVAKIKAKAWIGLSDSQQEGKWKWVDGTALAGQGFWQSGEPNNSNNEDCVEMSSKKWNDVSCDVKMPWICEG